MKLAEALSNRADLQRRVEQMRGRLQKSALVQEDENPPENPQELLDETGAGWTSWRERGASSTPPSSRLTGS